MKEIYLHRERESSREESRHESMLAHINEQKAQLASSVRKFSEEQAPLWRHVPSLIIESEGRMGYSDDTHRIVSTGILDINIPKVSQYDQHLAVNLQNGILLERGYDYKEKKSTYKEASDEMLVHVGAHITKLDAVRIVEHLMETAQQPTASYMRGDDAARARLRDETRIQRPDFAEIRKTLTDYKKRSK